jgi:predicted Zn finger-like uncharacterized protein
MEFSCPKCNASILVDNKLPIGEEVSCPKCKTNFEVEYDYAGEDYELYFFLTESKEYIE